MGRPLKMPRLSGYWLSGEVCTTTASKFPVGARLMTVGPGVARPTPAEPVPEPEPPVIVTPPGCPAARPGAPAAAVLDGEAPVFVPVTEPAGEDPVAEP